MTSHRYCFALDLKDDADRIKEYEAHHLSVWPEVQESFRRAGVEHIELYRAGNRLVMIFETDNSFTFEKKKEIDESDPVVRKWEALMSTYQQEIPGSPPGGKWVLMKQIFNWDR